MKIRKQLKIWFGTNSQRGVSLVEAAVAVLLLGGAVTTLVMGMSTGALAVQKDDQTVTAQGLARTEMEYIKGLPFDSDAETYPLVAVPEGYTLTVSVDPVPDADVNIQKITAVVTSGGNDIYTLQNYKVDR
jgi:hypothetical protein